MELFYREIGTGDPMIILHGVFGTSDNWITIGKQLGEQYHVYMVDQRNHGQSPHSDQWDYPTMAADLSDFMQQQSLEKAIIVGHSMGGKVAMQFALDFPDMIKDLVIVDIGPKYYPPHHQKILEGMASLDLSNITSRSEADTQLSAYVPEPGVRQFLLKNLGRDKGGKFEWDLNLPVIKENIEKVGTALPEKLHFDRKCLFVRGEKSKYILEEDLPGIEVRFPKYVLETINGAGHWVHAEKPSDFLKVLTTYLEN